MQPATPTLRQRHIQALQRRAGQHDGAVRQLIEARLQALRAAEAEATGQAPAPRAAVRLEGPAPRRAGLLAELLAHIEAQGAAGPRSPAGAPAPAPTTSLAALDPPARHPGVRTRPRELKALRDHAPAWAGLRMQQRVRQALAAVPPQAGPLNTQRLLHETLCRLQAASPAYLQRLVAQVETLLWLEQQAQGAALPKPARPARAPVAGRGAASPGTGAGAGPGTPAR
jgi:hypothetical protein